MAWIELHQTLPTHRKTIELAAMLDIEPVQAVGHLCCLWLWALDNAEDGRVYASRNALRNRMVATVSQWRGDPDEFVGGLVEAGFLRELDEGLEIHDWDDYAGKLMETRKSNRERQRRYRESKKQEEDADDNVTRDVTVTSRARHAPTVPNRTVPNHRSKASSTTIPNDSVPYRLAEFLRDELIAKDKNTRVPSDLQGWALEADRMFRLDNRDPKEAAQLIRWCQQDPFWNANILSMKTFRAKYDALKRQANRPKGREKDQEQPIDQMLREAGVDVE